MKKFVIVGGVAGGATIAARLRRLDEESQIVLLEKGEHISFANCGLPYYIGETIKQREKLLVQTVKGMSERYNLDIRIESEATKINRQAKTIEVRNLTTGEMYLESYDYLVLSPGAKPFVPEIKGLSEASNVFVLRNIPDADHIKKYLEENKITDAAIIGGGFIGLEMAENLYDRGVKVTLIESNNKVMPPLDYELACILHSHLKDKRINLILEDGLDEINSGGKEIVLRSGRTVSTQMIILSIGIRPENKLAAEAGLDIGHRGGIAVNNYLQTSDESIFAVGDAVEVKEYVLGHKVLVPLAWPANRQARLAADNIYGLQKEYKGTLGTAVAKVFDLTAATTGLNEKTLKELGQNYQTVHIHPNSHAGYYPGAFPISLKMTFDPVSGRIFGVQGVGVKGVEKRIDVIATAIKGGLTVQDLQDLELAYAPPYSSAKDPVNMLGYVASNVVTGFVKTVQYHEIDGLVVQGNFLLDVRQPAEIEMGSIKGSVNIPLDQLRLRLGELPRNKPIYVTCQVGLRGYLAARILMANGFEAFNLDGGYRTYSAVYGKKEEKAEEITAKIDDTGEVQDAAKKNSLNNPDLQAKINNPDLEIDACGLQCPGPIKQVFSALEKMQPGQVLAIAVTDPGFCSDIKSWCRKTGNTLLNTETTPSAIKAFIQKGPNTWPNVSEDKKTANDAKTGATLIVFDQDLDKAIASFIIATGAASMGKEVTMFFTFWGLNILRKHQAPKVSKDILEKAFGMMMPQGIRKLPISNMNMGGLGAKMISFVMKRKNVDSLETLIKNAQEMGVKIVACSMSLDVMGIKKEELLEGVEIGGVASYLGKAEESNLNLFI